MEKAWLQNALVIPTFIFAMLKIYKGFQIIQSRKALEEDEEESTGSLDDLVPEIAELILLKSSVFDYPQLRLTCSTWRTIIDKAIQDKYYPPHPYSSLLPQFPCLLLNNRKTNKVLNLSEDKVYTNTSSTMRGCECVGRVEGWLVFTRLLFDCYPCIFFFNPVSGRKIMLPPPTTINPPATISFYHVVASCAPDSTECVVAAIVFIDPTDQLLVFCKIQDESWSIIQAGDARRINFWRIVFHGNKLYAASSAVDYFIKVFHLSDANRSLVTCDQINMIGPKPHIKIGRLEYSYNGFLFRLDYEFYSLVISPEGEVFVIFQTIDLYYEDGDKRGFPCSQIKGFRVFQMDLNRGKWYRISDLGDNLFFVDKMGAKVISATALKNNTSWKHLVRPNCVYFTYVYLVDPETRVYAQDIGCFCLTDSSINRFHQYSYLTPRIRTRFAWFTPTYI